jgi:hypothetical protein
MKMKVTIEIITGTGLIQREIECDYLTTSDGRYSFYLKQKGFECDCGSYKNLDKCIGSYPQSAVIILNTE